MRRASVSHLASHLHDDRPSVTVTLPATCGTYRIRCTLGDAISFTTDFPLTGSSIPDTIRSTP
jgi:hypothetical protein